MGKFFNVMGEKIDFIKVDTAVMKVITNKEVRFEYTFSVDGKVYPVTKSEYDSYLYYVLNDMERIEPKEL